ncbi:hypothetical protein F4821DRAFT_54245 [Hypoxylon rubiginosum]|uniref:Uncharacterized protein n=1 Tax=Hypoxylon rubiginosum TaxID=110542 RepID=A0ACC0CJH0_9PEZI|nr:hypothetical protein F4821DRAFT_54245 [Hypoxylon rubiginosum]
MLVPLVVTVTLLALSISYYKLRYIRFHEYSRFPQLPTSLLFGHLQVFGGFMKRSKPNAHVNIAFAAVSQALGRPPLVFLVVRPVSDPMVVVVDYEIAEQVGRRSPKHPRHSPQALPSLPTLWLVSSISQTRNPF